VIRLSLLGGAHDFSEADTELVSAELLLSLRVASAACVCAHIYPTSLCCCGGGVAGTTYSVRQKSGPLKFFAVFSSTVWDFDMKFYSLPCTPSGIKPHAYFIVLQGLNFRKNYVSRKKFRIQGAYQPFVAMTTENP